MARWTHVRRARLRLPGAIGIAHDANMPIFTQLHHVRGILGRGLEGELMDAANRLASGTVLVPVDDSRMTSPCCHPPRVYPQKIGVVRQEKPIFRSRGGQENFVVRLALVAFLGSGQVHASLSESRNNRRLDVFVNIPAQH